MGPRHALRWAARRPRVWVAFGAAVTGTLLTRDDRRPAWTGLVALVTFWLAGLSARFQYEDEHPDRAARAEARERERLQVDTDRILARFAEQRGWPAPPPRVPAPDPVPEPVAEPAPAPAEGSAARAARAERRAARQQAEVEKILARHAERRGRR